MQGDGDGGEPDDRKSSFVLGLAESQGTLAVIAALLAGFSYSGFCSVSREEIEGVSPIVQYAFVTSTALSASMALFVTIGCSLCEQQGRVARSFAVLRSFDAEFEEAVHQWWKSFAQIRTNAVFLFIYSIPVFFASMACIALIKLPKGPCCVALGTFTLAGVVLLHQLLHVNDLFRTSILRYFTSATAFAAPSLDPEPNEKEIHIAQVDKTHISRLLRTLSGGLVDPKPRSCHHTVPPPGPEPEGPRRTQRLPSRRCSACVRSPSPTLSASESPSLVRKTPTNDGMQRRIRRSIPEDGRVNLDSVANEMAAAM